MGGGSGRRQPVPRTDRATDGATLLAAADRIERALFRDHERLILATRVGGLGIWDHDIATKVMVCDAQWHRIMGLDPARPVQTIEQFRRIIHPEDIDRATEVDVTAAKLISAEEDYHMVFRIIRPDGELRWVRSAACILKGGDDTPVRAVGFVVDITDRYLAMKHLEATTAVLEREKVELSRQALIDPLTGLANRRRLETELDLACRQAERERGLLAVAMIDVDFFKGYNDRYGHAQGDAALRAIAEVIGSAAWRPYDLAVRYGGEEFVVLLPGIEQPEVVLERICRGIADLAIANESSTVSQNVTVSCGCAIGGGGAPFDPATFLAASDEALYRAKRAGRNRTVSIAP